MPALRGRGFNLVEMLVAFMLLAYTFAGVMYLFPTSSRALLQSRTRLLADHLCRRQLEQASAIVLGGDFASLLSTAVPYPQQQIISTTNGVTTSVTFTYRLVVTNVNPELKDVESVVEWSDGRQIWLTSLKTLVTRP